MSECVMCDAGVPTKVGIPVVSVDGKPVTASLLVSQQAAERMEEFFQLQQTLGIAKEELYAAIQAIENNDLPYARSSALRAANLVVEAWQTERKYTRKEPT